MVPLDRKTVRLTPPDQDGFAEADRRAYEVEIPTYYRSAAMRATLAREHGVEPQEVDLLREIANGLEAIEPDEDKRGSDRKVLALAIISAPLNAPLEREARVRVAVLKDRALRLWEPYRLLVARQAAAGEYATLEIVRRFVVGFHNLYDPASLPPAVDEGDAAGRGDDAAAVPLVAEVDDGRLTEASLERIPASDLIWLATEIGRLEAPRGRALIKKSERPSSPPTTAKPSTTAASGPTKTRRRKAKDGSSKTSGSRTASRSG
jgi:hypothetical protein